MIRFLLPLCLLLAGCATAGKTDVQFNYLSHSGTGWSIGAGGPNPQPIPPPTSYVVTPSDPQQYSAIFKISDGATGTFASASVAQGNEDSLNLNNAVTAITVSGDLSVAGPPGLRVLTIKGGSLNNTVSGTLHQHGTSEDIKLGDWSDQSYAASKYNDLSGLAMADGSKIKVVVGHAKGTKLGPNERVDYLASFGLKSYWWLKRVVRVIAGIPVGTPGPSWLP